MNSKDDDEIEDVGYCRPPVRTRFKKGQSGNPHGRPHRRVKVPSLDEILMEKVKVKVGGKTVEMTQLELVERSIIGNIQKGDAKAIRYLLDLRKLIPAAS